MCVCICMYVCVFMYVQAVCVCIRSVYMCMYFRLTYSDFLSLLLQKGFVQHNPTLGCFTVIGSVGKPCVVKMFPTQSCSCPASSQCYHILAVKMSIGLPVQKHPSKVNLTQLRHNTRSRNEKRSGRKAPRPGNRLL